MFTTLILCALGCYGVAALASRRRDADMLFGRACMILGLVAAVVVSLASVGNVVHYMVVGGSGYGLAFLFAVVAFIAALVISRTREALERAS